MQYKYNFPAIKPLPTGRKQINKIIEETAEVLGAKNDIERIHEVLDLIHACETYLRIMEAKGIVIESIRKEIERKNKDRGYYENEICN